MKFSSILTSLNVLSEIDPSGVKKARHLLEVHIDASTGDEVGEAQMVEDTGCQANELVLHPSSRVDEGMDS